MKQGSGHKRSGFTLLELTLNLAVTGVLMSGIGAAVVLATRAMPDGNRPIDAVVEGADKAHQIAGELYFARSLTEKLPTAVTFTVADRDGDLAPETIRYAWSGTPGDPLTRQYNSGAPVTVLPSVYEFALDYTTTCKFVFVITIALRAGSAASTRVDTAVQLLNAPEVAGP